MPELSLENIFLFAIFIAPGAISIFIHRQYIPDRREAYSKLIVESAILSIIYFSISTIFIIPNLSTSNIGSIYFENWPKTALFLFIIPIIFTVLFILVRSKLADLGFILTTSPTAWDSFFDNARKGCWIIVHLKDGEKIGGRFGVDSYASAFPDYGHIYIQELWELDSQDNFTRALVGPQGIILRPTDYKYLRVFKPDDEQ